jgi:hypothetical protein
LKSPFFELIELRQSRPDGMEGKPFKPMWNEPGNAENSGEPPGEPIFCLSGLARASKYQSKGSCGASQIEIHGVPVFSFQGGDVLLARHGVLAVLNAARLNRMNLDFIADSSSANQSGFIAFSEREWWRVSAKF